MPEEIEVKFISEKEILIGQNSARIFEGNIILVTIVGQLSTEISRMIYAETRKLERLIGGEVNYLIDLNRAGKNSPEANRIWKHAAEEPQVYRVAQFGLHPVAKVLASFVNSLTSKNNIRFFNSMEEAIVWIKA